jgi:hypothetical protein
MSYIGNQFKEFPCCYHAVQPGESLTVEPLEVNATIESSTSGSGTTEAATSLPFATLEPLGRPVDGTCGKVVENVRKVFNATHDGMRYRCTIKRPLKQTQCTESCVIDDVPVRCQVYKHIRRRKGYTCVPYTDGDQAGLNVDDYAINRTYKETVTSGCRCFAGQSLIPESSGGY